VHTSLDRSEQGRVSAGSAAQAKGFCKLIQIDVEPVRLDIEPIDKTT
jgi:hypothetical protein